MNTPRESDSAHVNYDPMDRFKIRAQRAGRATDANLIRHGFAAASGSRGESAYVIRTGNGYLAHVLEGIGTKPLVADRTVLAEIAGQLRSVATSSACTYYDNIARCAAAAVLNDLSTVGARPLTLLMHLAVGGSDWFDDTARADDLLAGWRYACDTAMCVYGGGETSVLHDIIVPGAVELSGSATGVMGPGEYITESGIADGDAIVLLASSGIHANGLTDARHIADIGGGYLARIADGRTYGEALLDPSVIYAPVISDIQSEGIRISYATNITGHGWRKLMRPTTPWVYEIDEIPEPQPVFGHISDVGGFDTRRMYDTFNMGAGFALYVRPQHAEAVADIAEHQGVLATIAGRVLNRGDRKYVDIKPLGLRFEAEELRIR